ncbi:MAG: hypothetical protein GWN71_26795, partial [Gammaproteobacteria bacterium]|nr:hypothetical protein [Gammaproteobacteria bacterium]
LDPGEASADYRRLVDAYPDGPYADRALLRLALAAEARGDLATARLHYASLADAYSSGDPGRYAAAWLAARESPAVAADS